MRGVLRHKYLAIATVWLAALPSGVADGLDGERFAPAIGTEPTFQHEHPTVPFHLGWGLGLFFNLADNPVVERVNDDVVSRPLDTSASVDLTGSIGFWGWSELGIHVPMRVYMDGDPFASGGTTLNSDSGVGDLRLVPKVVLLRSGSSNRHFMLGLGAPITLPTGDPEETRGAGGVTVEPRILTAIQVGKFGVGADLGYRWRSEHPSGVPWANEITMSFMASLAILPHSLRFQAEIFGGKQVGSDVAGANFPLETLAGLFLGIGPSWTLHAGAGLGLGDGIGAPDARVVAGVRFRHRAPLGHGFADADHDGLLDKDDNCSTEAEDPDGFHDEDGCPESDNDEDGIADDVDECPDTPEERGGDGDGCPSRTSVRIVGSKIQIFGKIQFKLGSVELDARSEPLLDQMAAAMKTNPAARRVRIEGHTDNLGGDTINQPLSLARAQRVRQALIDRGIAEDRLETLGRGESQPLAPNATRAGRAKNRRVEFIILEHK